jgi:hypothetical protein
MGEWLLSRRDRLIVARHEVPGWRCREAVRLETRTPALSKRQRVEGAESYSPFGAIKTAPMTYRTSHISMLAFCRVYN